MADDDDQHSLDPTDVFDQQKPRMRSKRSVSTISQMSIPASPSNEKESDGQISEDENKENDPDKLENSDENGSQKENEIKHSFTMKSDERSPSPSNLIEEVTVKGFDASQSKVDTVTPKEHSFLKYIFVYGGMIWLTIAIIYGMRFPKSSTVSIVPVKQSNWRNYVDPDRVLSSTIRSNILASLKPVSASALQENTVATLLIFSKDEQTAADIGRCLLKIVNSQSDRDGISPEINFQNDTMNKLEIDNHLQALLKPDETMLGTLIRNIDNLSSKHALDRVRLLFSYCDGENPKIPNRFIIMTATEGENIRQRFATAWPEQSDLIDPLMARISGNTIVIDPDQKSICKL